MGNPNPHGRITTGISADTAALRTLEFIKTQLAAWRDDPERPSAQRERDLNAQFCKFLNVAAKRCDFGMVHFHHEEAQGVRHSADFSASTTDADWIEGRTYNKYEPLLVVEGKRLPTPGTGREREYVSSPIGQKPGGGIQRFKLGLHGPALTIAGMVGYVQEEGCSDWFVEVNHWIDDLASSADPLWTQGDRLGRFKLDSADRTSRCDSEHQRKAGISSTIRLTHLWVEM